MIKIGDNVKVNRRNKTEIGTVIDLYTQETTDREIAIVVSESGRLKLYADHLEPYVEPEKKDEITLTRENYMKTAIDYAMKKSVKDETNVNTELGLVITHILAEFEYELFGKRD